MLTYFTLLHGLSLIASVIIGFMFLGILLSEYDGDRVDTTHVWVRRSGQQVRPATVAEVYRKNNPGKSYYTSWKKSKVAGCVALGILGVIALLVLPLLLLDKSEFRGYQWTENPACLIRTLLLTALAAAAAFRADYAVLRWSHLKRRKNAKYGSGIPRLTSDEEKGYSLSGTDSKVSSVAVVMMFILGLAAELAGTRGEGRLFALYGSGVMAAVQGGFILLFAAWALTEHFLRKRRE